MAITKIQCLNEAHTGNPAAHLKNALSYIQNPEKTEENVMVGSINCLPDTAFEQMMDTKVTFGKTNKRQGYHIIISFAPGEATEEQALDIVARFAQEYLKDKYEAVYAVHNDKKHMHGHIVFNSVSFETGMKHECKKGEWKHRMQPITNRLCKEYGLSIVPAEYVKEPKNLSRNEWEREQCFRKMILADAEFCQSQAGSFDHFIFLMKRIGYQFEYGKYLSVKVPGGKWYHELDKLDERFSKEKFRFYLDMPFSRPRFVVGNTVAIHKRGITDFQMKYYRRIYQARMVEQRRFDKHSAYLAKELERMKQLQDRYKDDKQRLNQAMMELYRTEKINPVGGCLPIMLQIPVFLALYWVLQGSVELRGAPWVLWVHDLAMPDPWFVLPAIMAVTMFLQILLNPKPTDPTQARMMYIMPIVFSVMFFVFASGLVLYWLTNNVLSILQQWWINKTIAAERAKRLQS